MDGAFLYYVKKTLVILEVSFIFFERLVHNLRFLENNVLCSQNLIQSYLPNFTPKYFSFARYKSNNIFYTKNKYFLHRLNW